MAHTPLIAIALTYGVSVVCCAHMVSLLPFLIQPENLCIISISPSYVSAQEFEKPKVFLYVQNDPPVRGSSRKVLNLPLDTFQRITVQRKPAPDFRNCSSPATCPPPLPLTLSPGGLSVFGTYDISSTTWWVWHR